MNRMESRRVEVESFYLHPLRATHSDTSAVPSPPQSAGQLTCVASAVSHSCWLWFSGCNVDSSDYQQQEFTPSVQLEGPGEEAGCREVTEQSAESCADVCPTVVWSLSTARPASLSIRRRVRHSVLGVAPRTPQSSNETMKVRCPVSDCQRLLEMNGVWLTLCVSPSRRDKNRSGAAFSLITIDKQKWCILLTEKNQQNLN